MVAVEAVAYPALAVAVCGAYVAGRRKAGAFALVRGVTLALMAGAMLAAQVKLTAVGLVPKAGVAWGVVCLAGVLALMALCAWDATSGWRVRDPWARASSL